jgi:hypothetical protein
MLRLAGGSLGPWPASRNWRRAVRRLLRLLAMAWLSRGSLTWFHAVRPARPAAREGAAGDAQRASLDATPRLGIGPGPRCDDAR